MATKIFYIIQRKKDSMYFHRRDITGENWFTSEIMQAELLPTRLEAELQIRCMQNWLKRPKFKILQVERRTGRS